MRQLDEMAATVGNLLKTRNETVAVTETSAGGLISAALLAVPGASAYFVGGGVTYTYRARDTLLDLNMDFHPGVRPASEDYVVITSAAIRERLGADWGLGESGASGPSGNRYGDAPGHSCVAVSGPVSLCETVETGLTGREDNMWRFAEAALALLEKALRAAD